MTNTKPISPLREIAAYEALWGREKTSFKWLSELFASHHGSRPSDFVTEGEIESYYSLLKDTIRNNKLEYKINILLEGTFDYPRELKDAREPVELLYFSGNLDYLTTRRIAVVGTRKPTREGLLRTAKLVKLLVKDDFTIVSGLAAGIDTEALSTAIAEKGRTIAVIGTPINQAYPRENVDLQKKIAMEHLLISQVPFERYKKQSHIGNRLFFPERNKTMSALSEATVIIEASETSGTLTQARAALFQKRKLFILDSCFQNKNITWPQKFLEQGAIRVKEYEDIINALPQKASDEPDKD
jgi:DNA processing protein